jgi:hypothetical protein
VPGFPKLRKSKAKVRDVANGLTTCRRDGEAGWERDITRAIPIKDASHMHVPTVIKR